MFCFADANLRRPSLAAEDITSYRYADTFVNEKLIATDMQREREKAEEKTNEPSVEFFRVFQHDTIDICAPLMSGCFPRASPRASFLGLHSRSRRRRGALESRSDFPAVPFHRPLVSPHIFAGGILYPPCHFTSQIFTVSFTGRIYHRP